MKIEEGWHHWHCRRWFYAQVLYLAILFWRDKTSWFRKYSKAEEHQEKANTENLLSRNGGDYRPHSRAYGSRCAVEGGPEVGWNVSLDCYHQWICIQSRAQQWWGWNGHYRMYNSPSQSCPKGFWQNLDLDKPPGPPPKTGYHRYVFLLLEGDNSNLTAPEDRRHWGTGKKGHGVRDWAQKESLQVIGANFFYEENKKQWRISHSRYI